MDSLVAEILVVVVVQVLVSESACVSAGTEVLPVVVVVGDVEEATVNVTESIVVTNEGCFVVVVEVVP